MQADLWCGRSRKYGRLRKIAAALFVVFGVLSRNPAIGALSRALWRSPAKRRFAVSLIGTLAMGFLAILPAAAPSPVHVATAPAASGGWLTRLNQWRASTDLTSLTEDATWSQGDYNHALYMVKNNLVTHYETVGVPYYTSAGDTAARNGNIQVSSTTNTTDEQGIDWWMAAPFHAMGMMDPRLTQTGFGAYRDSTTSPWKTGFALDTIRANSFSGGQYPVYFPGNGTTQPLTTYKGGEYPDPLQACSGYSAPTGLPVFIQVGGNVNTTAGPVHSFTGNGVPLNHCVIDSSNAAVSSYLYARGGVIVVPQSPLQSGVKYVVALTVNGTPYTWSFTVGSFITSTTPCTSAGLTADLASPQNPGAVITVMATSTGCPNPQYLFYLQSPGGAWALARSYGGPTWAWNTAGLAPGTYVVDVWVRDNGSGVDWQAIKLMSFTLSPPPACANAALAPDKASPQTTGTTVTFTASSTACSQPTYLFYVQTPGGAWNVAQGWGGTTTFVWATSGLTPGTYHVNVWVRQSGSAAAYETFMNIAYTLNSGAACTAASLSSAASPQQTGTIVAFTASSTGCSNAEYLYYVQLPNGNWSLAQGFGGATFAWNTAGLAPGTYHVNTWARQKGSTAAYEAFQNIPYTLIAAVPCTAANLTSDKASPQAAGTTVTFAGTSTGCSQPQYLFYVQTLNGAWTVVKYWGSATLAWNTTGLAAGTYHVNVWVRQNGSSAAYETFKNIAYSVS